jgi:hypothetical protein
MIRETWAHLAGRGWSARTAVIGAALLATSCLGPDLKVASEAQTGCQADEIGIVNEERGAGHITWTAWCRGQPYLCSGGAGSISCQAVYPRQPVPAQTGVARGVDRAAPRADWARFDLPDCGLSAEFPAAPKGESRQVPVAGVPMTLTSLTLEGPGGALVVSCTNDMKSDKPADILLDGARAGMLKNPARKLVKESAIVGGREIQFEEQGHLAVAHLRLLKGQLVTAIAMRGDALGTETAKRFLDSVSFVSQPAPAQPGATHASDRPAADAAKKKEWLRFELTDCGIGADFPATPKATTQQQKVGKVSTSLTTAALDITGTGALQLACSGIIKSTKPVSVVLDGGRTGMLKSVSGKLLKETDIVGGREISFDVQGHLAVARLLWVGDRMVMALVVPVNGFGAEASKRFLDSVSSINK